MKINFSKQYRFFSKILNKDNLVYNIHLNVFKFCYETLNIKNPNRSDCIKIKIL